MAGDAVAAINALVIDGDVQQAAVHAARLRPRLVAEHLDYHALSDDAQPWLDFARAWVEAADPLDRPEIAAWHVDTSVSEMSYLHAQGRGSDGACHPRGDNASGRIARPDNRAQQRTRRRSLEGSGPAVHHRRRGTAVAHPAVGGRRSTAGRERRRSQAIGTKERRRERHLSGIHTRVPGGLRPSSGITTRTRMSTSWSPLDLYCHPVVRMYRPATPLGYLLVTEQAAAGRPERETNPASPTWHETHAPDVTDGVWTAQYFLVRLHGRDVRTLVLGRDRRGRGQVHRDPRPSGCDRGEVANAAVS